MVPTRLLSCTVQQNLFTTVALFPGLSLAALGRRVENVFNNKADFKALFALGCLLFIMTMIINLWVEYISSRRKMLK